MSFKIPCGGFKLDEESFSLDKNDVLSIPKPLTYDYMPEGYPKKDEEVVTIEVDITWDGNTTGLVASSDNHHYRVSPQVYTLEQFKKMNYVVYDSWQGQVFDKSVSSVIEQGAILNSSDGLFTIGDGFGAPIIVTEEAVAKGSSVMGGAPDTFTEPGVYFPADGNVTRLYSPEPIVETVTTIKKLSEDFLPDNPSFSGTVEGTAMIVKSSTAGSSKRFKITVDDSGTISATEVT